MTEIADVIESRLSANTRRLLNLPVDNGRASATAVYHRVVRAWSRFTAVCDPFPGATHERKSRAEVEKIVASYEPSESLVKRSRMRWVMNTLLEATWQLLDEKTRNEWVGNIAMDSTPIFVWGKRGQNAKNEKPWDSMSPEFMAGWAFMHNDPMAWGYHLHIAVTTPDPYQESRHPILAIAASVDTPMKRIGENFVSMLESTVERGHPRRYAIADRGIFGFAGAEALNRPVIDLGYKIVMDYKKVTKKLTNGNVKGTQRGVLYVDGTPLCPATPPELVGAPEATSSSPATGRRTVIGSRGVRFTASERRTVTPGSVPQWGPGRPLCAPLDQKAL